MKQHETPVINSVSTQALNTAPGTPAFLAVQVSSVNQNGANFLTLGGNDAVMFSLGPDFFTVTNSSGTWVIGLVTATGESPISLDPDLTVTVTSGNNTSLAAPLPSVYFAWPF